MNSFYDVNEQLQLRFLWSAITYACSVWQSNYIHEFSMGIIIYPYHKPCGCLATLFRKKELPGIQDNKSLWQWTCALTCRSTIAYTRHHVAAWRCLNSSSRHIMTAISQTIFSDTFSWMTNFVLWLEFHWSLFLMLQLTINQRWFR